MSYSFKQQSQAPSSGGTASAAQTISDQRTSNAVQLKQQHIMHSAHLPNVIQQLTAEKNESIGSGFENAAPAQMHSAVAPPAGNNAMAVQLKSGWKGEGEKYNRVANKDVVRVVPALVKPANSAKITGTPDSQGECWYPTVESSVEDTKDIDIVLGHDSDPGAKITPYVKDGYTSAPARGAFAQETHYHKGTLKAKRVKEIAANTGTARDFTDKPVTYSDNIHDYVDANAGAATTFDRF
jgi:hypothetical protein